MKNYSLLFFLFITNLVFAQTDTDGLYFDGVNDNITVDFTTNINSTITNNRTYETSFKVENASSTTKQIIMKEGGGTRAVIIYVEKDSLYLGAYNRTDYTPIWEGTFYREKILSDTWYHVALVFDDAKEAEATDNPMTATANNALKWYLDGALMGQISGYQLGGHNSIRLGYKNETLRFPSCGSWTATGLSEYCFGTISNDNGGNEYYFNGYIWGFRVWNDVRTQSEIQDNATNIITTVGDNSLVAALDGDTFTYLDSDDDPAEADVSVDSTTGAPVIWSPTAGTTAWSLGTNWVGDEIPNATTKELAQIQEQTSGSDYPIITSGQHIITGDLIIDSGASITINSGGTLEILYDLTNNGTITVEDGGSLILREKVATISTGTFNVKRATPVYADNDFYSYWSSPVIPTDSNITTVFADAELIYKFEANEDDSDWALNGTADFETGIGYAVQNEGVGGQLRTFSGNINKGDIVVDVYNTSNLEGEGSDNEVWSTSGDNLVGNPYSAAIDWDLVILDPDNTEIEGTINFWNQNTAENGENNVSDYLQYNSTGGTSPGVGSTISSGQGFFIKTTSLEDDLTITFKTTHQIAASNTTFYKSNTPNEDEKKVGRSWFKISNGINFNTLLIGFLDGARDSYDRVYDGLFDVNQKTLGFYSLIDDNIKTCIQGLPTLIENEKIISLGFLIDETGEHTISIQEEYIDEAYYIYLLDTEKGITVDLRKKSYNFTIDTIEENTTRFKIIYSKEERDTSGKVLGTDSVQENDSKNLNVFVNKGKELIVSYDLENVKKVTLFNIQGREVVTFLGEQVKDISNLSMGVYIVAATLEDNRVFNNKIMIAN